MPTSRLLAAIAALLLSTSVARATTPLLFTYDGLLQDGTGAPITGLHDFTFRFYGVPVGGTQLGTDVLIPNVPVAADGYFSVVIDVSGFAPLLAGQIYMAVKVDADAFMSPRIQITSVPGALSVPFGGITDWPSSACPANQFAVGYDVSGNLVCAAVPPAASGITSVTGSGPITASVTGPTATVGLQACPDGQILKFIGTAWGCAPDAAGSSGTVTSVATGTGLTGGPITTTGTVSIDTAVVPRLAATQSFSGANTFSSASNSFTGSGAGLTGLNASNLGSGTVPGPRVSGAYTGITQVGSQTGLTLASDMNGGGFVATDLVPRVIVQSPSFQGSTDAFTAGGSITKDDGVLELHTGTAATAYADVRNGSNFGWTTAGTGSFLAVRVNAFYIGGSAFTNGHTGYIIVGGTASGTAQQTGGYGFRIRATGTARVLEGVTFGQNGVLAATPVTLSSSLGTTSLLYAVNRGANIEFFVNGVSAGLLTTTGMNTSTFSTYGVRVQNGGTATDASMVVAQLTVGQAF